MKYIKADGKFFAIDNFKIIELHLVRDEICLELDPVGKEEKITLKGYNLDWIKYATRIRELDFSYLKNELEKSKYMRDTLYKLKLSFEYFLREENNNVFDIEEELREIAYIYEEVREAFKENF